MKTKHSLMVAVLTAVNAAWVITAASAENTNAPLGDKTLVSWVAPANLTQRGGSVLTIAAKADYAAPWDGIVFGEVTPGKWMAGSEFGHRLDRQQAAWPAETADTNTFVQLAIVYKGKEIIVYRDGKEYSHHTIQAQQPFGADSVVVIGRRHPGAKGFFAGAIDDARIYDRALTAAELAALKPNVEGEIKPWAWWTFDDAAAKDQTGRFTKTELSPGAKVVGGNLLLNEAPATFMASF